MTESDVFNIREICRGCLSDNRENLRSIFDTTILGSFISCTNVQVTMDVCFVYLQTISVSSVHLLLFKGNR